MNHVQSVYIPPAGVWRFMGIYTWQLMLAIFKRVANESQRYGQAYHIVLSREAYCSCKVCGVSLAFVLIGICVLRHDRVVYDQQTE